MKTKLKGLLVLMAGLVGMTLAAKEIKGPCGPTKCTPYKFAYKLTKETKVTAQFNMPHNTCLPSKVHMRLTKDEKNVRDVEKNKSPRLNCNAVDPV